MKIVLCDDDPLFLDELKQKIICFLAERLVTPEIIVFQSGIEFLKWVDEKYGDYKNIIDLLFIDIDMPEQNGLETLKKFREYDLDCISFIISNYKEYVFHSFELNTFQFLPKPINTEMFESSLQRGLNVLSKKKKKLLLQCGGKKIRLNYSDIILIESLGKFTQLYTIHGSFTTQKKISEYDELLKCFNFLRTHKSFLINMEKVLYYKGNQFFLVNNHTADISQRKRSAIIKEFEKFILRELII